MSGSSPRVRGKQCVVRRVSGLGGLIPARAGKTPQAPELSGSGAAHPRACGENFGWDEQEWAGQGSSPRVRGKRGVGVRGADAAGLIPARAGKTRCSPRAAAAAWAHPRACGENSWPCSWPGRSRGSSPRVRGKLRRCACGTWAPRLIPARAGKTPWRASTRRRGWAHPRACGENSTRRPRPSGGGGSSPRVRGKLDVLRGQRPRPGLIPARAGKTGAARPATRTPRAHPRACGENEVAGAVIPVARGSSPRVRGKPGVAGLEPARAGLIPARAGKTPWRAPTRAATWAHPRACGENRSSTETPPPRRGSSPRVRGKLGAHRHQPRRGRLIPARAGKTGAPATASTPRAAHPRACGENPPSVRARARFPGSSPRVRGKPGQGGQGLERRRLIPARAGKTRRRPSSGRRPPAHPRACGENSGRRPGRPGPGGSSPRVRGKRHGFPPHPREAGLIPARAGKTGGPRLGERRVGAHPRACGENWGFAAVTNPAVGSSPRVRGKPMYKWRAHCNAGLIPARAGKTPLPCRPGCSPPAHPRACGENSGCSLYRYTPFGSSPRVRGKPPVQDLLNQGGRLIPARAGKTATREKVPSRLAAHPRACGENAPEGTRNPGSQGSSPRVRGKPPDAGGEVADGRLIPARAGKTR